MELFFAFIWLLVAISAIVFALVSPRLADKLIMILRARGKKAHGKTAAEAAREVAKYGI